MALQSLCLGAASFVVLTLVFVSPSVVKRGKHNPNHPKARYKGKHRKAVIEAILSLVTLDVN